MQSSRIQDIFLVALLVATSVLAFYIFEPFLIPLALAAIFAVVLYPLYRRIHTLLRGRESVAALLTVLVSLVCIITPIALLSTRVAHEAGALYASFDAGGGSGAMLDRAFDSGARILTPYVPDVERFRQVVSANVGDYAREGARWLASNLGAAFASVASLLLSLFIFLISLYYLLRDGERMKQTVMHISPLSTEDEELVSARLAGAVNSVVKGNLLVALVQSALSIIGFSIFGVPNAVLWGVAAFFAALIPGIGTALVFIPAVAFLFLVGDTSSAFGLMIWGAVAVGMIDNVLGPRLIGKGMNLHPLLVLPGVLGGIGLFGPAGIFLGPLTLCLLFALLSIYSSHRVVEE